MRRSVLITTLPPRRGGVPAKTEILARLVRDFGYDVTIAHYATLSDDPALVAPSWRLARGAAPGLAKTTCFGDFPCLSVGCRFPELEFPYYLPSALWRDVIRGFDRHIAVGGTVLVAYPLVSMGVPHMTWCASTMIDDRIDRRAAMPFPRRTADRAVIGPVQRVLEKRILSSDGRLMAVSEFARKTLIAAGADPDRIGRVPIPVDLDRFCPPQSAPAPFCVGFAGRADDPRKNIALLLRAVAVLSARGHPVRLKLTGEESPALSRLARDLGIGDLVRWTGWMDAAELPAFYASLDVFAFSSGKEGLGISGVEAMASGVPVVSTRCGGPEDYVIDGETGKLCDGDPESLADAVEWVASSRERRHGLGRAARTLVERTYGRASFERDIARVWTDVWGEAP